MDGGYLLDALPLIGAVVDAFGYALLLQKAVDRLGPALPPFLGFGLVVPVNRIYFPGFERAAFQNDTLVVAVEYVFLSRLRRSASVLFHWAHCQHDVCMRVSIVFIVDANVGAHPG